MDIVATLAIIFCSIYLLILLFRAIFLFILERSFRRYLKLKKLSKKLLPKLKKDLKKEEEELIRKLEIPRAHSAIKAEMMEKGAQSGSYEIMASVEQQMDKQELNSSEIVDFVKPIGFWTSMILGQKLTYLIQSAHILNKRGDKGFWTSMIEAKERAAGRQHGRGR